MKVNCIMAVDENTRVAMGTEEAEKNIDIYRDTPVRLLGNIKKLHAILILCLIITFIYNSKVFSLVKTYIIYKFSVVYILYNTFSFVFTFFR